ncbi:MULTISPECIES: DNA/RNA nuclease SfsA [unclassified Butyrivibrio]|uniref:DNA/RNA nuclease SfsA n=1 Tax=unclassified Butyrivibrio TaxID=2639466 RepID=UPI0003B31A6A|nr:MULTISPECIES: DNA/RNA nuclease SfsA [unclassified Butyrivibrio]SEM15703.1 sugar fermentation stimulation protein A [Butyrivibrio sp. ob235]
MIIYENTVSALFIKRNNRFTAEVLVDGHRETVHVKNTGRLGELLLENAEVTLQKSDDPGRKTKYDLISVYRPEFEWINVDSLVPNKLMKQYLEPRYDYVKAEYTYGNSRFDFYMEKDGEKYLTEVKGCTLSYDQKSGVGYFPDAPTERGIKHLQELAEAVKKGYHCTIAFVIQMNGIYTVLPNDKTQPEFEKALEAAKKAGVEVVCHSCHVEADRISIVN